MGSSRHNRVRILTLAFFFVCFLLAPTIQTRQTCPHFRSVTPCFHPCASRASGAVTAGPQGRRGSTGSEPGGLLKVAHRTLSETVKWDAAPAKLEWYVTHQQVREGTIQQAVTLRPWTGHADWFQLSHNLRDIGHVTDCSSVFLPVKWQYPSYFCL